MAYQDDTDAALAAAAKEARSRGDQPRRAPHVTSGPVGQDSSPFSLYNFVANGLGRERWDKCKVEKGLCEEFRDLLEKTHNLLPIASGEGWLVPYNLDHFGPQLTQSSEGERVVTRIKAIMQAGAVQASDPDEEQHYIRKGVIRRKAQSAFNDELGGSLIAPPTQGEVIQLIRPIAALTAAGVTQMGLPANGRYVAPRITGAPSVMSLAESEEAVSSDLTTDFMTMTARKVAGSAIITDEGTMYTTGTLDNYVRDELNRSLGLKWDAYGFYGPGGPNMPSGLLSSAYSSSVARFEELYSTARGIGTDGNTMFPEYVDAFEAIIGEKSFNMESEKATFVMRPGAWASVTGARADAVTAGDKAGSRVDLMRRTEEKKPDVWAGRSVIRTTNIRGDLAKNAGTNLSDVFYGIWSHMIMGTYGAVQFKEGYVDKQLTKGQKTVVATMFGDIGLRYPAAFMTYRYVKGLPTIL